MKTPVPKVAERATERSLSSSAVRIPKAGEVVASQLRRRILRGELKEGDTLAQESDMMSQFGVSRPTLREAFRLLEAEGLISISRGTRGGASVHRPSIHVAARYMGFILQANNISLDDVYSTRILIEPAAVRRVAAKNAVAAAGALRDQIAVIQQHFNDDRQYGTASADFHRKVVELAGIKTLSYLMDMVHSVLEIYLSTVAETAGAQMDNTAAKKKGMRAKEKLVELIEAGDVVEAEAFWRKHLEVSQQVLLEWQPGKLVPELFKYA